MYRLTVLLVTSLFAASAYAGYQGKPKFEEADKNGDGKVSIQEAKKVGIPKEEAKSTDLDSDGKLAKSDWKFIQVNSSPEFLR